MPRSHEMSNFPQICCPCQCAPHGHHPQGPTPPASSLPPGGTVPMHPWPPSVHTLPPVPPAAMQPVAPSHPSLPSLPMTPIVPAAPVLMPLSNLPAQPTSHASNGTLLLSMPKSNLQPLSPRPVIALSQTPVIQ